jgi:hypothetical protein
MPDLCRLEGKQVEVLPGDLGSLFLNETQAGRVELRGRDEVYRPRLGMARTIVENGIPQRHIAVRLAYADQRADAFLRQEASQLPKTAPGLVMIQTSGTTGGFRQWAPILSSRLRPRQHTRVGAIVLFQSGMMPDEHGIEAWHPEAKWISNPYAAVQLPDWIPQNLERHYE